MKKGFSKLFEIVLTGIGILALNAGVIIEELEK